MTCKMLNIRHGNGRLTFTPRDPGNPQWWRELKLDGQPLYRIGNNCDTCEAVFSRINEVRMPLAPGELSARLRGGLTGLPLDIITTVTAILPDGRYAAGLLTITPGLFPAAYRVGCGYERHAIRQKTTLTGNIVLPEIFLPLIHEDQYDPVAIEGYEKVIAQGSWPTALAISVLDVRFPSGKAYEWQLAHFLLDGHHKIMAACRVGRPITMLSFYALDHSFGPKADVEQVLQFRYRK